MLICREICFVAIYAVLAQNLFCRDLRTFVWRKKDKYQVWGDHVLSRICQADFPTDQPDDIMYLQNHATKVRHAVNRGSGAASSRFKTALPLKLMV